MMIITKEIKKNTPEIGAQSEGKLEDLKFYFKLFLPWGIWTWYVAEANFETGEMFGLVDGFEKEVGYFNLKELLSVRKFGLGLERDRGFTPKTYKDLV